MINRMVLTAAMLFLGVLMPQNPQEVPVGQIRRSVAIDVLRTINMAEVLEQRTYGSFTSWQTLVERHPEMFDEFMTKHGQRIAVSRFATPPEILPGLRLRFNLHIDGQGYEVLLEDTTQQNGYAVLTDERASIRESKWI